MYYNLNDLENVQQITDLIDESIKRIITDSRLDFRKKSVLKMEKVMVQSFDEDLLQIWRQIGIPFGIIATNDYKDISPCFVEDETYEYLTYLFAELVYAAVVQRGTQFIEPNFD